MREFIKSSKKFLVGLVSVLAICMIIGSYQTVAAEKNDKYQAKNPNSLFGMAADFGVFADKATIDSHMDSNYAAGTLNNAQSAHSPACETFYIGNYTGNLSALQFYYKNRVTNVSFGKAKLYIGSDVSVSKNGNQWVLKNSKGEQRLNTSDVDIEKVNNPYIDIKKELDNLTNVAKELKSKSAVGATGILKRGDKGFTDDNNRSIICTPGIENVLNITKDDLNYDRPLYISNIRKQGTSLIINVDTRNTNELSLNEMFLGEKNAQGNEKDIKFCDADASKIIWNFGDFSGTIHFRANAVGTILAPKAKVSLEGGNLTGSVIANEFKTTIEVHFVAPGFEKEEEKTPVEVCIESVDGTCCPSLPVTGADKYVLYKKQSNGKYKKVAGSEKATEFVQNVTAVDMKKNDAGENYDTFLASWKIEEAGEYYIKQINKVSDAYTKTPTRCKFKVVDNAGKLELQLIKGKEANGESNKLMTYSFGDKKLDGFKLRNYQNIVSIASLNEKQNAVLPVGNYSIYKCTADDVVNGTYGAKVADAETDINGFRQVNIQELGYYCVVQEGTVDGYIIDATPKYFVVFKSPIGHIIPVEFEDVQFGFKMVEALGGKFEISKLTKKINNAMNTVLAEYGDAAAFYTDGWIVFINQPEAVQKVAKVNEAKMAKLLEELQQEVIEQANETVQEALDQEVQNVVETQGGQN